MFVIIDTNSYKHQHMCLISIFFVTIACQRQLNNIDNTVKSIIINININNLHKWKKKFVSNFKFKKVCRI